MRNMVLWVFLCCVITPSLTLAEESTIAVPILRLEKPKYVLGEKLRFWVGVNSNGERIPQKYWNTCFLHITKPDGTSETQYGGWPMDGIQDMGWIGGHIFEIDEILPGKYILVFEFAGKKTEPVDLIVEELDIIKEISVSFIIGVSGNISMFDDIPITLVVENHSAHAIQFPGYLDEWFSRFVIHISGINPPKHDDVSYSSEIFTGIYCDNDYGDYSNSCPMVTINPGDNYNKTLYLNAAYQLWGPGKYEINISTIIEFYIRDKDGKFDEYGPIRFPVVSTGTFMIEE